jgi:diphthamide synthase (EF-2-diphthine--ammonia ligase)
LTELHQDLSTRTVGLYAGAYVEAMLPMLRALFAATRQLLDELPEAAEQLRLWFVGSNYAASDSSRRIESLAHECGVESLVREFPARVPYFDVLTLMCHSGFNLLLGSTARGYNPSKLFTLLQAGQPVLGLVQPGTQAEQTLLTAGGAATVPIPIDGTLPECLPAIRRFLADVIRGQVAVPAINDSYLSQFTAAALAERQAELFDRVLANGRQSVPTGAVSRSCQPS